MSRAGKGKGSATSANDVVIAAGTPSVQFGGAVLGPLSQGSGIVAAVPGQCPRRTNFERGFVLQQMLRSRADEFACHMRARSDITHA